MGVLDWTDNYRAVSNELATPKVLVCPEDKQKVAWADWPTLDGDRHISYFLGYDAHESRPQTILAGDRGVTGTFGVNSYELSWTTAVGSSIDATFDTTLHGGYGHIVLSDASVHHASSLQVREQIMAALSSGSTNVIFSLPHGVP